MEEPTEVSSEDRLWAAIGYPIPIVALIGLFMDDKKSIPFFVFYYNIFFCFTCPS